MIYFHRYKIKYWFGCTSTERRTKFWIRIRIKRIENEGGRQISVWQMGVQSSVSRTRDVSLRLPTLPIALYASAGCKFIGTEAEDTSGRRRPQWGVTLRPHSVWFRKTVPFEEIANVNFNRRIIEKNRLLPIWQCMLEWKQHTYKLITGWNERRKLVLASSKC